MTNTIPKYLFGFFLLILSALAGYFLVYTFVMHDLGSFLSFSSFRSQLLAEQSEMEVSRQLTDLGYEVSPEDITALHVPSSTHYQTDILQGFRIDEAVEAPGTPGFYFYDASGNAFYLELDADGQIIPDSVIPLIQE